MSLILSMSGLHHCYKQPPAVANMNSHFAEMDSIKIVLTCYSIICQLVNPLAGIATFLSPTVHGRSDNIVVFP